MVFKNRSQAGGHLAGELVEFQKDTKAVVFGLPRGGVVVAIPVAAPSSVRELEAEADQVVCLDTPEYFYAVGQAYQSFDQVSDEEVCNILNRNA